MGHRWAQTQLDIVREELDALNVLRMVAPLDDDQQAAYEQLCTEELDLLSARKSRA